MKKERLDVLLVQRGLSSSRERAKADIMSGLVYVAGQRVDKAGTSVPEDSEIELRGSSLAFVSRGGLKLEKALDTFGVTPNGKICVDCGASTGGFTDCMLKRGAEKVYAIDVGYGQLAWSLRSDERVVVMERTNIRYVTHEQVPDDIQLAVIDVSFISLRIVLPAVKALLAPDGEIVCLIKPQFEAGKEKVGKKGVVRDISVHKEVLRDFVTNAEALGFGVKGITFSPIKGPEGNIEYLGWLQQDGVSNPIDTDAIADASHGELAEGHDK
ncbi:MAG: TlyA family RNA methyltransferase [Oscillospiraceae bacterium]|nr:TlyA family RNA methyltransferase [Oscillospiraceae bacterium]